MGEALETLYALRIIFYVSGQRKAYVQINSGIDELEEAKIKQAKGLA
jgi:hypothetical protein